MNRKNKLEDKITNENQESRHKNKDVILHYTNTTDSLGNLIAGKTKGRSRTKWIHCRT